MLATVMSKKHQEGPGERRPLSSRGDRGSCPWSAGAGPHCASPELPLVLACRWGPASPAPSSALSPHLALRRRLPRDGRATTQVQRHSRALLRLQKGVTMCDSANRREDADDKHRRPRQARGPRTEALNAAVTAELGPQEQEAANHPPATPRAQGLQLSGVSKSGPTRWGQEQVS